MREDKGHMDFTSQVIRYLSDDLSPGERLDVERQIQEDPQKKQIWEEYRKVWEGVDKRSSVPVYDLDAEWNTLKGMLPNSATVEERQPRTLLFYTYRIAAALVVGLLMAFAWIYATQLAGTQRVVAENDPVEVMLEDGTEIVINRQSWIRIPKDMESGNRQIRLSGEAWFQVARDTLRPFIIHAGEALVEVLGTSFNVNAYRENDLVEITVESGVVALTAREDQQEQIVLRAGNSGTLEKKSARLQLQPKADPNTLSWRTRELYFDHTPLQEVVSLINRVYQTRLVIANPQLEQCPITVTFSNQSLDAVLTVLEMTLELEIQREQGEIILDGPGCIE